MSAETETGTWTESEAGTGTGTGTGTEQRETTMSTETFLETCFPYSFSWNSPLNSSVCLVQAADQWKVNEGRGRPGTSHISKR